VEVVACGKRTSLLSNGNKEDGKTFLVRALAQKRTEETNWFQPFFKREKKLSTVQ
jgi:hypothetical protein